MARVQGRPFSDAEIARIRHLLSETEMSIPEIAARMGCTHSPIVSINRRFGIRHYNGRRVRWELSSSSGEEAIPK